MRSVRLHAGGALAIPPETASVVTKKEKVAHLKAVGICVNVRIDDVG